MTVQIGYETLTAQQVSGDARNSFFGLHLVDSGDSPDLNVDGSVAAVDFLLKPPAGYIYLVDSLRVVLADDADFGVLTLAGIAAPAEGVLAAIQYHETEDTINQIKDLLDGAAIVSNQILATVGKSEFSLANRMSVTELVKSVPIRLTEKHSIRFRVQDDLTAIAYFRVFAAGRNCK